MSVVKQISATARTQVGKGAARAVRREGKVPAVIYGGGQNPLPIALDSKEANRLVYAGHFLTTVFEIDVEGKKTRVIPRDYHLEPVKDAVEHVDFLRLAAGSRLRIDVPVHIIGSEASPGVKLGGAINIVVHALSLNVPADSIPDSIDVDISALQIGESIHVSQVKLPEGASLIHHDDETLVSLVPPTVAIEPEPAAAAAAPAAAAPAAAPAAKK